MEADFNYNVAKLKPEVEYKDGTLAVRQPDSNGMPALADITDYRNEWGLRLYDKVPMDLRWIWGWNQRSATGWSVVDRAQSHSRRGQLHGRPDR